MCTVSWKTEGPSGLICTSQIFREVPMAWHTYCLLHMLLHEQEQ